MASKFGVLLKKTQQILSSEKDYHSELSPDSGLSLNYLLFWFYSLWAAAPIT